MSGRFEYKQFIATALLLTVEMLTVAGSYAQTVVRPAFEVASIKVNTECGKGLGRGGGQAPSPGRLNLECVTVRDLIQAAYDSFANGSTPKARRIPIVGGPNWMDSERYDLEAKAMGGVSLVQMAGPMLQVLLEDRFKLTLHRETREMPVYLLTIAKTGIKKGAFEEAVCVPQDLNRLGLPDPGPAAPSICDRQTIMRAGQNVALEIYGASMASLSEGLLSNRMDRPVIDKTGLTGRFDLHLEFVPDDSVPGFQGRGGVGEPGTSVSLADGAGPSIFTALQEQLGLKLSAATGPAEVIVVDHVERPSDN
jgi:uncharacterized protein (TIGR03435 family)